jgi:hypothetical protein
MRNMIIVFLLISCVIACRETHTANSKLFEPLPPDPIPPDTSSADPDTSDTDPEQIFITDRTGKKWNITHAVNKYGFEKSRFQFGLGPYAIQPINEPQFVISGQQGFPSRANPMQIIGTTINGDSRAYSLNVLHAHEIINDTFADVLVAVGY